MIAYLIFIFATVFTLTAQAATQVSGEKEPTCTELVKPRTSVPQVPLKRRPTYAELAEAVRDIQSYVIQYRNLGGKLYWLSGKLSSRYANAVDMVNYETKVNELFYVGNILRAYLTLERATEEEKHAIDDVLFSYQKFESLGS